MCIRDRYITDMLDNTAICFNVLFPLFVYGYNKFCMKWELKYDGSPTYLKYIESMYYMRARVCVNIYKNMRKQYTFCSFLSPFQDYAWLSVPSYTRSANTSYQWPNNHRLQLSVIFFWRHIIIIYDLFRFLYTVVACTPSFYLTSWFFVF